MQNSRRYSLLSLILSILAIVFVVSVGAAAVLTVLLSEEDEPSRVTERRFEEPFVAAGNWGVGAEPGPDGTLASGSLGVVQNGVYDLQLFGPNGVHWATAGETFGNGRYEVDVHFIDGPLDNAGGILLMFNREAFYFFVLRGDGNALIARCEDGCRELEILGTPGWFPTQADWGQNSENRLRVDAYEGELTFYVNNALQASIEDDSFEEGDLGIIVVSGDKGTAHFAFDNVSVSER